MKAKAAVTKLFDERVATVNVNWYEPPRSDFLETIEVYDELIASSDNLISRDLAINRICHIYIECLNMFRRPKENPLLFFELTDGGGAYGVGAQSMIETADRLTIHESDYDFLNVITKFVISYINNFKSSGHSGTLESGFSSQILQVDLSVRPTGKRFYEALCQLIVKKDVHFLCDFPGSHLSADDVTAIHESLTSKYRDWYQCMCSSLLKDPRLFCHYRDNGRRDFQQSVLEENLKSNQSSTRDCDFFRELVFTTARTAYKRALAVVANNGSGLFSAQRQEKNESSLDNGSDAVAATTSL